MRRGIVVVAACLAACSPGTDVERPRWSRLVEHAGSHREADPARSFRFPIPASRWQRGVLGQWVTADPLHGTDLVPASDPVLTVGERTMTYLPPQEVNPQRFAADPPGPGSFYTFGERLAFHLEPGSPLPDEIVLDVPTQIEERRADRTRIAVRGLSGDGFSVRAGETVEMRAEPGPEDALRFQTVVLRPSADGHGPAAGGDELSALVVEVDGRRVLRHAVRPGARVAPEAHTVDLRGLGRTGGPATLRFRAEGADAVWAVVAPVLGPAEIGRPGERPWDDSRPNLIVFLIDTLRADALTTYGGTWELSPNIDRFAAESVVFERVWSPSSWTLPAQASLFTATYPYQHGARRPDSRLGDGLATLAERLRDAGYRTGAVTDGAYVSRRFGLDRGFEWFREHKHRTLEKTSASMRRFLDADDGRPFFLYVQTYRVHGPFDPGAEVLAEHGERLGIESDWLELSARLDAEIAEALGGDVAAAGPEDVFELMHQRRRSAPRGADREIQRIAGEMHRLYRGGVLALDAAFGEWVAELDRRELRDDTFVVFTSDHGEAFGEHHAYFHADGVWEEVSRIPLVVRGPGLEPRRTPLGGSLVDLPRTVAGLLGVEPAPAWLGTDLFAREGDAPVYFFDVARDRPLAAWVEGEYKVAVPVAGGEADIGDPRYVYDLARDPAEAENLAGDPPPGVRESLAERAARLRALLAPLDEAGDADLDADTVRHLEAMGYVHDAER